jgi:hypothetical protein
MSTNRRRRIVYEPALHLTLASGQTLEKCVHKDRPRNVGYVHHTRIINFRATTVNLTGTKLAHQTRAAVARGIWSIFEKKFMHRARVARPRGFDSLPSQDLDRGRCPLSALVLGGIIENQNSDFIIRVMTLGN